MTAPNARLVIAAVIIVALSAMTGTANMASPAATQSAEITITATTTETDAPVNGMVEGEQPIELQIEYSGLGSGTQNLVLAEEDSFDDDIIREFSVEGDSGSETFHLSADELAETKETGPEDMAHLYVGWGDEGRSNTLGIWWQETTVYTKGYGQIPDTVAAGEEVTVEYYGWTSHSETHVRLMEDDRPHGNDLGGNDEQIRRDSVSGPGYFDGTFTFTPSDYVNEDNELEIQARAEGERQFPDVVRGISVAEPETVIDASIIDFSPSSGEYRVGEEVRSEVEVENTGNTQHTFFVGYGAVDEEGNPYDNERSTGTSVTLDPGERDTVTVSWEVEEEAPAGSYTAVAVVWKEGDSENLETRIDENRVEAAFEVVPADTNDPSGTDTTTEDGSDDVAEPPLSEISITVVGPAGERIEGATIVGEGAAHEADIPLEFTGETDGDGRHENLIYENEYTIEVDHPDYVAEVVEHTHDGESDLRVELDVGVDTAPITVRVVGPDGEGIEGASVTGEGEPHEADIPIIFDGETDANGEYTDVIYENKYTVQITHPDYEDSTVSHTHEGESEVIVELLDEERTEPSGDDDSPGDEGNNGEGDESNEEDGSEEEDSNEEDGSEEEVSDNEEESAIAIEDNIGSVVVVAVLILLLVGGLIATRAQD